VKRLTPLLTAIAIVASSARWGSAQELHHTIDPDVFFEDEPVWIVGLRPALGYDPVLGMYPQIGLDFGHAFGDHLYLGLNTAAQLDVQKYMRAGLRVGAFFGDTDITFGTGVSPGVGGFLLTGEWGPVLTWGVESRLRLDHDDFITAYFEVDLHFEALGFWDDRSLMSGGIGWSHAF